MSLHDGSIDDGLNVVLSISRIDDPLPFGVLLDVVLREELETHVWCHRLKTKKGIQKLLLSSTVVMQTYSCNCTTKLASCVEKTEKRINKNKKYGHRSHPATFKVDAPMGPIWKSYVTSFSSCVHKVWCPCHPPSRVMTIPYQPNSLLELRGNKRRLQHSAKLINPLLLITEQINS